MSHDWLSLRLKFGKLATNLFLLRLYVFFGFARGQAKYLSLGVFDVVLFTYISIIYFVWILYI